MSDLYLYLDGQTAGPYPPAQLRQMLAEAKIQPDTPAWHSPLTEWSTVAQILAGFPAETKGIRLASGPIPAPSPRAPSASPPVLQPEKPRINGCLMTVLICFGMIILPFPIIAILAGIALGPINKGLEKAKENAAVQQSRAIALTMFQYSVDHNGAYPDGATSTEVFQKLIDEKYISDPKLFYVPMAGKVAPSSSRLSAENVSFDVTSGIDAQSPDDLPIVFSTGYTVTYTPGASAVRDQVGTEFPFPGLVVAYKNNSASFKHAVPDASVPDFIPTDFNPGAQTCRQLRP